MVKVESASGRFTIGRTTKSRNLKGKTKCGKNSKLKPPKKAQNIPNLSEGKISFDKVNHVKASNVNEVNKKIKSKVKSKEIDENLGQLSGDEEDLLSIDEDMFADEDDWDKDLELTSNKKGQKIINNIKPPNVKEADETKSEEIDESLTKFADDEYLSADEDMFSVEDEVDLNSSTKEEKVSSNESLFSDEDDDSFGEEGDELHVPNADLEVASDESDFEVSAFTLHYNMFCPTKIFIELNNILTKQKTIT